jgi:hypothetical protein
MMFLPIIDTKSATTVEVWKKFPLLPFMSGFCHFSLRIPQLSVIQIIKGHFKPYFRHRDWPPVG